MVYLLTISLPDAPQAFIVSQKQFCTCGDIASYLEYVKYDPFFYHISQV